MFCRFVHGLVLVLIGGCGSSEIVIVVPDLPDEVDRLALVFLTNGEFTTSTGLLPIDATSSVRVATEVDLADGSTVHLFGYAESALEAAIPADRGELERARVRPAGPGQRQFPPAARHALGQLEASSATLQAVEPETFALTASWLPACEPDASDYVVGVSCATRPCLGSVAANGCGLSFDVSGCLRQDARLQTQIDAAGGFSIEQDGPGLSNCRLREGSPGTQLALRCLAEDETCLIDVRDRRSPEVEFELDRLVVEPGIDIRRDGYWDEEQGSIRGLVAREDRVYVHHRPDEFRDCPERSAGDVVSTIDANTLTELNAVALPVCVTGLTADPAGPGVIAIGVDAEGPSLVRLDAAGQIVMTVRMNTRLERTPVQARGIASRLDFPWLGALLIEADGSVSPELRNVAVVRLDPATLETTNAFTRPLPNPEHLIALADGRAALLDDADDELIIINWDTMMVDEAWGIRTPQAIQPRRTASLLEHLPSMRLFFAHGGEADAGLVSLRKSDGWVEPTRVTPEHQGTPIGTSLWPPDENLVLVSYLLRTEDTEAYLTLYDVNEQRFRLGAQRVGRGLLRNASTDAAGRVWMALAWTGEILRITPR